MQEEAGRSDEPCSCRVCRCLTERTSALHSLLRTLAQQCISAFRDPITWRVAIGRNASSISGIPSLYGKVVADKKNKVGIGVFLQKKGESLTLEFNPELCGTENSPVKHFERRLYLWRQLTL